MAARVAGEENEATALAKTAKLPKFPPPAK